MANLSQLLCFIFVAFALLHVSSANEANVGIYQIKKGNFYVNLTNWGARITSIVLPDKQGNLGDIVLGYDTLDEYKTDTSYFGAIVGRVANRIKGAQFTLNDTTYNLVANDGKNTLHGGQKGFSDVVWQVKKHSPASHCPYVRFHYQSADGEQGFPGKVIVSVNYMITVENQLSVTMKAKALNKATPVNLAQHTYWNLGGHNSGDILSETLQIFASQYTPVDSELIPTGEIAPVKGTPYDFGEPQTVGSRIDQLPNGYDINYVVDAEGGPRTMKKAAILSDSKSGRVMELRTSAPGLQLYTADKLKDIKGKNGAVYKPHAGLCLETQGFPDSLHHPDFPSQIITPKKTYKHFILYTFKTTKPSTN
ncbi:PREDICTED: aldose 1-epimerase-like [Nelumbo nucifera]|uniref:Aldose 1-epimerase n=1 Tax=Nelumbo nucifera TaxID=4432 RepID=A0A1U7YTJ2_NELNU|nr:PREDICTED: aldose 1-epimerase-like [Nelumbo nucifera]